MSFIQAKKSIIEELEHRIQKNSSEHLKMKNGLPTGIQVIDDYLHWRGLPADDLTLLTGSQLYKSIQLWFQTVNHADGLNKKAAWVHIGPNTFSIEQKNIFKFTIYEQPQNFSNYIFQQLNDIISSNNFQIIGVHMAQHSICLQHLQDLKDKCRKNKITLIFISQSLHLRMQPVFPLIIDCENDFYTIQKAEHRPTPMVISDSMIEADFNTSVRSSFVRYVC